MDVRCFVLVASCLSLVSSRVPAAPFVAGDPQPIARQIASARAAVIARAIDDGDRTGGWRVVSVLHDATGSVKAGSVIHPRPAPPESCQLALLMSNADRTVRVEPLTSDAAAYVTSVLKRGESTADRIAFAAERIEDPDPFIANDAFAEIAQLSRSELEQLASVLPAERLRAAVANAATPTDRLSLYGFLLGLRGTPQDADCLRDRFFRDEPLAGTSCGIVVGYLLLSGEDGLIDLEENVLAAPDFSVLHAATVLDAFAFLRREMPDRFTRDRLRQAACAALNRREAGDLAVSHLAACRDWDLQEQVLQLLSTDDPDPTRKRAVQVTVVRYLLECHQDSDAAPSIRAAAKDWLERIGRADADLLRRAGRLSGAPPDRQ